MQFILLGSLVLKWSLYCISMNWQELWWARFQWTQQSSPPWASLSHTEVQLRCRRATLAPNSAKSGYFVYETISPSLQTSSLSFPRSREMNSGRNPHWGPNTPAPHNHHLHTDTHSTCPACGFILHTFFCIFMCRVNFFVLPTLLFVFLSLSWIRYWKCLPLLRSRSIVLFHVFNHQFFLSVFTCFSVCTLTHCWK